MSADEHPEVAGNGPLPGVLEGLAVRWDSYDVGDQVAVRDPYAGVAVPRRALVRAKDAENPDRPRVKVRYLDTRAVTWIAASRILDVVRERSSGV